MKIDVKLTEHFWLHEFACGGEANGCACHGCAALVDQNLVHALEEMRVLTGHPMKINSAVRCDSYNTLVHGHISSFHRVGKAADVTSKIIREDLDYWSRQFGKILVERLGEDSGNVIKYSFRNFIHLDVGHRIGHEGLVRSNVSQRNPVRGW